MLMIAVDPGASGGIARMFDGVLKEVYPMPETDGDVLGLLKPGPLVGDHVAIIERVGGYVGGVGQPGSAMFEFGDKTGFVRGALMALGFRIDRPRPQEWQRALNLGNCQHEKVDSKASPEQRKAAMTRNAGYKRDWKNKLKARAQELYPDQKVTLKTADALLLLEYGRLRYNTI